MNPESGEEFETTREQPRVDLPRKAPSPEAVRVVCALAVAMAARLIHGSWLGSWLKLDPEDVGNFAAFKFLEVQPARYPDYDLTTAAGGEAFRDEPLASAILFEFCRNVARDMARKVRRHYDDRVEAECAEELLKCAECHDTESHDTKCHDTETEEKINKILAVASDSEAKIVGLLRHMGPEEAARVLDVEVNTIHQALSRLRKKLGVQRPKREPKATEQKPETPKPETPATEQTPATETPTEEVGPDLTVGPAQTE